MSKKSGVLSLRTRVLIYDAKMIVKKMQFIECHEGVGWETAVCVFDVK